MVTKRDVSRIPYAVCISNCEFAGLYGVSEGSVRFLVCRSSLCARTCGGEVSEFVRSKIESEYIAFSMGFSVGKIQLEENRFAVLEYLHVTSLWRNLIKRKDGFEGQRFSFVKI